MLIELNMTLTVSLCQKQILIFWWYILKDLWIKLPGDLHKK